MLSYITCKQINTVKLKGKNNFMSFLSTIFMGKRKSKYTLLIYMVGSDLESEYQEASMNIKDLMKIGSSRHVNVILETGGAKKWELDLISSERNQRWIVQKNNLKLIQDDEKRNMDTNEALSDFLIWGINQYPAEQYILILWGHGLGSVDGYGGDELYGNKAITLFTLQAALKEAFDETKQKFNIISFDACSMAGIETAYSIRHYADYLVASVDYTNRNGLDYKTIIESLQQVPTLSAKELGEVMVNSYRMYSKENGEKEDLQKGVIDLSKIDYIVEIVDSLGEKLLEDIEEHSKFNVIIEARNYSEEYGEEADMVDLADLVSHLDNRLNYKKEANAICKAIEEAVIYNMKTPEHPKGKGISIYFPKHDENRFKEKSLIYQQNEFSLHYREFIKLYSEKLIKGENRNENMYQGT